MFDMFEERIERRYHPIPFIYWNKIATAKTTQSMLIWNHLLEVEIDLTFTK